MRRQASRGDGNAEHRNKPGARAWYRFAVQARAEGDPTEAELLIFDEIGPSFWGEETVTAKQFIADLNGLPSTVERINLRVNSPGGSVFDAVAIANALKAHNAQVLVWIEALAASAATIVTMAGDRITIAENGVMMIHNPIWFAIGDAAEMRATADALDRITSAIVATYRWHSTLSEERLGELMGAVTWMDAQEAVDNGFATEIGAAMKAAANLNTPILAKVGPAPEKYQARLAAMRAAAEEEKPKDPDPVDPVDPPAPAEPADPPDPVDPPDPAPAASNVVSITATRERQIRDEEAARIEKIGTTFAAIARTHPKLATSIEELRKQAIAGRLSVEAAAHSLTDLLAEQSGHDIVNAVSPIIRNKAEKQIDTRAIYAKLNARQSGRGRN